jgi:hypothetical protein
VALAATRALLKEAPDHGLLGGIRRLAHGNNVGPPPPLRQTGPGRAAIWPKGTLENPRNP